MTHTAVAAAVVASKPSQFLMKAQAAEALSFLAKVAADAFFYNESTWRRRRSTPTPPPTPSFFTLLVLEGVVVAEGRGIVVEVGGHCGEGVGRVRAAGARGTVDGRLVVRVVELLAAQDAVHLVDA